MDGSVLRSVIVLCCFTSLVGACRPSSPSAGADSGVAASASAAPASVPAASAASAAPASSASAALSASAAAPTGSVALADAPDVRVTLPAADKAVVKVGQTFGILVPHPDDFLDEWELDGRSPLGEPLTFISRGDIGRELLWRIGDDVIGRHVIKLRLMHRGSRTSRPTPTKRVSVVLEVVRA